MEEYCQELQIGISPGSQDGSGTADVTGKCNSLSGGEIIFGTRR